MISNMLRFSPAFFEGFDEVFAPEFSAYAPTRRRERVMTYPQVNMGVTDKSVEVYLFVPGMDASALDVSLEKNLLSVTAKRETVTPEDEDTMQRQERFSGQFKRVITLPEDVDPNKTDAVYKDGVLHISIAKREESQPRKIQVNV
ncbi:MAG: Hsp20/alpha crystallin family protein [Aquificaceae bacterium]|nr:MAG: Hsp20/alpha crystallin family protein [Aquificaceae bacterium]